MLFKKVFFINTKHKTYKALVIYYFEGGWFYERGKRNSQLLV